MAERLEWWPEFGTALGVMFGAVRGFLGGGRSVGPPTLAAVGVLFVLAAAVHWFTKRAYFDRHPEHFLAAQFSAAIVLLGIGMSTTKEVVGTGTISLPFLHVVLSLGFGAIIYIVGFLAARRSFAP